MMTTARSNNIKACREGGGGTEALATQMGLRFVMIAYSYEKITLRRCFGFSVDTFSSLSSFVQHPPMGSCS